MMNIFYSRLVLVTTSLLIGAAPAFAKEDFYVSGGLHVDLGWEVGIGAFTSPNSNFGLGRIDLETGKNTGDANWLEGYTRSTLGLRYDIDTRTELFAIVAGVTSATLGDGDVGGFTNDGSDIDLDQAYAGFSSSLLGGKDGGGWDVTVSGGRQKLQVGDGFLFWGGNFDTAGDKTFWLAPRQSFDLAGIVKLEGKSTSVTGFAVQADKDNAHTEVAGVDVGYSGDWGSVGLLGGRVLDENGTIVREGMSVVSARAKDIKVPGLNDLAVSGELTYEFDGRDGVDFNAYGLYGQWTYTFADTPWKPELTYRFAKFSGDSDPSDSDIKSFDPLFYGFSGWGSWFMGEVVGEYMLFNSNQITHMVKLSVAPTESTGAGLIYYHFDLDKANYFGTPVSSKSFADELNAYAEWTVNENLYLAGVAGFAVPDTAAKETFGNKTNWIFEVYATYTY